jgi:manganese transport protein
LWGNQSNDYETRKDQSQLDNYIKQLKENGLKATGKLGYKNRSKEIVRLVKENKADMLVVGAHGHTGVKDLIYGETINSVRHELQIPILMVSLKTEKSS